MEKETFGEVLEQLDTLFCNGDIEEARKFVALRREIDPHADRKIGFLFGEFTVDHGCLMSLFFGVPHLLIEDPKKYLLEEGTYV